MEPIELHWSGRKRRYWLAPGEGGLVLLLHGTGGSALLAIEETRFADFAATKGFAVAFPDGLAVNPDLPAKFLSNPQRWNDGSTRPGDKLHTDHDDVGFLEAVIRDASARTGAERVFLTGFSNGAGMAFRFAAERTELIRAVAPVAGHCWIENPKPSRTIPTLFLMGDGDPLIPMTDRLVDLPWFTQPVPRPGIGHSLRKWAKGLGYGGEVESISEADGIRVEKFGPALCSITIADLGHHWPGGKGLLNPRIGGTPSGLLNANDVIWNFFRASGTA